MNYTRKSILNKITREFGSKIQNLPRKRKKRAKALFYKGLTNVENWHLATMLQAIRLESHMGVEYYGKGLLQFVNIDKLNESGTANVDPNKSYCEHCGREQKPCPGKLHANGERSYVGVFPCACKHPIMTDMGVVDPGTEEHDILLKSGNYSINDLLTPVK